MTRSELMTAILVTEHLIDTYSHMDAERIPGLQERLKGLEYALLDMMSEENEEWLEMFREQQAGA